MRLALARSITRGLVAPEYLRPGRTYAFDGGVLGRQALRIAVPPGVAVPSWDAEPLVDDAREGQESSP